MNATLKKKFEQLELQKASMLRALEGVPPAVLAASPGPGQWSVLQIVQHLAVSEERSVGYINKKLHYRSGIPKANWLTRLRNLFVQLYLRIPIKISAPQVVNVHLMDPPADLVEARQHWEQSRQQLRAMLEDFPQELMNHCVYKHALAGRLRLTHALDFFQGHSQRHFRQIQRTLRRLEAASPSPTPTN